MWFWPASSLICGNKMPTRWNWGFYCRSYCLLNMFRAPLCPSSGAQDYYTVVAACRGELSYLAPLGSENISAPYFKQCFFRGGITPPRQSNTTPPSPKTDITNILFYILNLWLRIYCSGLRGCDTREKEIVIWPCWCFMADIIFTLLSLLLCL